MENYKEAQSTEEEMSMVEIFNVIRKYKKYVLLPTIVCLILGLILGLLGKLEYESALEIRPNNGYIDTYEENIEGIINSYDLREYMVKKNNFDKDYKRILGSKVDDISDVVYWIDEITKIKVQANPSGIPVTISIQVKTKDKEFSKRVAMAYYVDLKEYMKLKRNEYYEKKTPYLEEKVKILGEKITEQNKNLEIMNGKINISALDSSVEKDILAYEAAMSELIDAKMEKSEYRNSVSLIKKPKLAKKPSVNKKVIYPAIGTLLGLMFGLILAFILNVLEKEKIKK